MSLIFDFTNGFHDSANAIATVVSTRALRPSVALVMAAILNFVGAFLSTAVAATIGSGIVEVSHITIVVVAAAVVGAIVWNLITWYFGIPSSSSHALIGGLIGAGTIHGGFAILHVRKILEKVVLPLVASPIAGLIVGFTLMVIFLNIFRHAAPDRINIRFKRMQVLSSAFQALSHGTNDAQKSMGIITLAVSVAAHHGHWPWQALAPGPDMRPPVWVIAACAIAMGLGTGSGGWRIIRTMGNKILRLTPIHGFTADMSSSAVILVATNLGMPVSTTHVITGSIMGVGAPRRRAAVRWGVAGNIVVAWVLTLPMAALVAALTYLMFHLV